MNDLTNWIVANTQVFWNYPKIWGGYAAIVVVGLAIYALVLRRNRPSLSVK